MHLDLAHVHLFSSGLLYNNNNSLINIVQLSILQKPLYRNMISSLKWTDNELPTTTLTRATVSDILLFLQVNHSSLVRLETVMVN